MANPTKFVGKPCGSYLSSFKIVLETVRYGRFFGIVRNVGKLLGGNEMVMQKEEINNVLDIIESKENLADTIGDEDERGKVLSFLYENGYISKPNLQRGGIGNKYKTASSRDSEVLRRP